MAMGMAPGIIPAALAVTPEEMLADPALESRARDLSKQLRCLVCQNQSIDDSDAELARDLRVEVRRQLSTGASDSEILANIRDTYGDYVLLNPPVAPGTWVLWGTPVLVIAGGALIILAARRRREEEEETDAGETEAGDPAAGTDRRAVPRTGQAALALGSLVLAASLGIYLMLGRADLPGQPLADRAAEIATATSAASSAAEDRRAALEAARSTAARTPEDVGAWLRLAMAAAAADESASEITALEQAERLTDGDPAIRAMRAEAMARAADGQVTIPVRELVTEILAQNPAEPRAMFLSGLAAYQDEDYGVAVGIWRRLQSLSAADAPWMALLAENIADAAQAGGITLDEVAPGPDSEQIAAAAEMSDEDRAAMIEGMVEGLAARLADDPSDAAGWQRLARAYQVMGRTDAAQTALIGAADARTADAAAQVTALEHMVVNQLEADFTDDAARLLLRLEEGAPNRPETLYITGHFAKVTGDTATARRLWQSLLDRIPEDAPIASQLRAAINAL
jgi:cytochrome c-type biogenesis protein CcmH